MDQIEAERIAKATWKQGFARVTGGTTFQIGYYRNGKTGRKLTTVKGISHNASWQEAIDDAQAHMIGQATKLAV